MLAWVFVSAASQDKRPSLTFVIWKCHQIFCQNDTALPQMPLRDGSPWMCLFRLPIYRRDLLAHFRSRSSTLNHTDSHEQNQAKVLIDRNGCRAPPEGKTILLIQNMNFLAIDLPTPLTLRPRPAPPARSDPPSGKAFCKEPVPPAPRRKTHHPTLVRSHFA